MRRSIRAEHPFFVALVLTGAIPGFAVAPPARAQPAPRSASAERPPKPNVVLVMLDDLVAGQLEYMPLTKGFFRANGVSFTRAYATTPLCSPARAGLLTGLYAHNHGIRYNENRGQFGDGGAVDFTRRGLDRSTLATWLSDAGYVTSLVGKYINRYDEVEPPGYVPPGWSDWHALYGMGDTPYVDYVLAENGALVRYSGSDSVYETDVLREKALDFVRSVRTPFFLLFAPSAPHSPATPAPRHADLIGANAPRNENYAEPDVSDKPRWIREQTWPGWREDLTDRLHRDASLCLAAADEAIAALADQLALDGRLANTLFIVMSDNGQQYGAHRWDDKRCYYEETARVPLLVAYPPLVKGAREDDTLLAHIDVAGTICEATGAKPTSRTNFRSFLGVLGGGAGAVPIRPAVYSEGWAFPNLDCDAPYYVCGAPTFRMVVNQRWKYVVLSYGERELYDLRNDPLELENRIAEPGHDELIHDLTKILDGESRE